MPFEIIHINNACGYGILVFSRCELTISGYINKVSDSLKEQNFTGFVVFDLLLSNGPHNRYYTAHFNGGSFEYNTFQQNMDLPIEITALSNDYYRKNIRLLKTCVLSNSQKQEFIQSLRK